MFIFTSRNQKFSTGQVFLLYLSFHFSQVVFVNMFFIRSQADYFYQKTFIFQIFFEIFYVVVLVITERNDVRTLFENMRYMIFNAGEHHFVRKLAFLNQSHSFFLI